jgi:hypothetical protein
VSPQVIGTEEYKGYRISITEESGEYTVSLERLDGRIFGFGTGMGNQLGIPHYEDASSAQEAAKMAIDSGELWPVELTK